ncbi:amidohydrolase family protein [Leifsonia poae]|uniref:Amidohydrolase n=1 Tax=Leifsonia poae TaxID=110933 RepID=A0A9W6LZD3_9MICO|nr:amidohydrolase family protein [Leifsonia poae]GLJ76123.1 amidohydrolase [Leifsonia poae]
MTVRVDSHVHLWNRATDPQDWIDPQSMAPIDRDFGQADLRSMLDETHVDRAVVVHASNSVEESVRLSRLDPEVVAGLVAWVDLTGDVVAQLDLIRATATVPVVGTRHLVQIDPDPEWLLREDVGRGLSALADEGMRFDLVVRDWQLPQARTVASRHSDLIFVLDHLGGPPAPGEDLSEWESGLRNLASRPNVVAKLSGLISGLAPGSWQVDDLRRVVEIALTAFGAERLLYGSDWPLAELGGGAAGWGAAAEHLLAELTDEERRRVFGLNAVAVYSLD